MNVLNDESYDKFLNVSGGYEDKETGINENIFF